MKKFFDYSKNRFLYSFLKLAILLLIGILLSSTNVKADVLSYKIQNRTSLPYDTYWSANETYTYELDQIEQSSQNRYMILRTCSTDYLDYSIVSNSAGKINSIGNSQANTKCDTDGHEGWYIDYYFYIDSFFETTGVYVNTFNLKVLNDRNYTVYQSLINLYTVPDLDTVPDYTDKLNGIQGGIDNTNKELKKTNDLLTDDTSPSLDYDSMLGWLPAGPLDSLLNLPLTFFNSMLNGLGKKCVPVSVPIPYLDKNYQLPCITSLYAKINGFGTFWNNIVGGIAGALILFSYFLKLYKWVDDTLTYRENNHIDNWGGV